MQYQLKLFPDTGHHYYFIPLAVDEPASDAEIQRFKKANELQDLPAETLIALGQKCIDWADWTEFDPARRWLRGRFGVKQTGVTERSGGFKVLGIWLAIETNTGETSDGYCWHVTSRADRNNPHFQEWERIAEEDRPTPYVAKSATRIDHTSPVTIDLANAFSLGDLIKPDLGERSAVIRWIRQGATDDLDVDLIIDFGNSRTIAFVLERATGVARGSLREICKPVLFADGQADARDWNFFNPSAAELVPDSWFILAQPTFDPSFLPDNPDTGLSAEEFIKAEETVRTRRFPPRYETRPYLSKVIHRAPHMFVQHSPAIIGPEAKNVLAYKRENVEGDRLIFMSSPKRYLWSIDPTGTGGRTNWYMHSRGPGEPQPLAGEMLRFMPKRSQRKNYLDQPSEKRATMPESPLTRPNHPNFSRSDSLVWTALSIIETAGRLIQSEAFRSDNPIRRRLANVTVTFPPGWTAQEYWLYREAWTYALKVYDAARTPEREDSPRRGSPKPLKLSMSIDEAIASQLAVIYSEIHHLNDRGREWINLYGKRRGEEETVRVLTIDIGGGTTDTSVVEYYDKSSGAGTHLHQRVLFSDSSTNAGDILLKRVIERVLLPALAAPIAGDVDGRERFKRAASADLSVNPTLDRQRRMLVTRTVLVPLALRWLQDTTSDPKQRGNPKTKRPWSPLDLFITPEQVARFNALFEAVGLPSELLKVAEPFAIEYQKIEQTIRDWFQPVANLHACYLAALDCDLVIVTGKPSEQAEVKAILRRVLPIDPERIVFAAGYYAGDWLPASADGCIPDAKMVTVLGATIVRAIKTGVLGTNWRLEDITAENTPPPANHWGVMTKPELYFRSEDVVMPAQETMVETKTIGVNSVIARARFMNVAPEPVYRLRWKEGRERSVGGNLTVKLRRVTRMPDSNAFRRTEHLELAGVTAQNAKGTPIALTNQDIELQLCTLWEDSGFWLDHGRFDVEL